METMYFVLGMLSIIAAAIVSVLVWGIVKINKQQQSLNDINRQLETQSRELNERFIEMHRDMDQRSSWIHQRIDEYHAKLHDRIDRESAEVNRRIEEDDANASREYERIYNEIAEARSYTDSRIDKVLSTTGAKQVIKG